MTGFVLQPFITIAGTAVNSTVIQSASAWVDVGQYEDLTLFTDVREVTGGPSITFETAPVAEDAAFTFMFSAFTAQTGVRVDSVLANLPGTRVPPARFIRWRLTGAPNQPWDITFRVHASAYALA
jgi:hypothetical protein